MTKNQTKSKVQKVSKKKPAFPQAPTCNSTTSSHHSKSNNHTSQIPSPPTEEDSYPDDQEAEYTEHYTWTAEPGPELDPETRISTPSYISYTDVQTSQAPDYPGHSIWNQELGPSELSAHQTPSWSQAATPAGGQYQAQNAYYTPSTTNHSTNYTAAQAQPYTSGSSYPPVSSAPYQPPYPPTTEYPLTKPQLDSWVNETSNSNMPVNERLTGRHYS